MGILIRNPGFLTTVQDLGRVGFQQFGVPVSGVMDRRSFVIANILVGNDDFESVLEITMLGPQIEFEENAVIALTGGDLSPLKNGQPLEMYRAHAFNVGDVLSFSMQKSGCRAYLAIAGGLDITPAMGSCSTYLKAKLGGFKGRKLAKDDVIPLKAPDKAVVNLAHRKTTPDDFSAKNKTLRVVMGPQDDCFTKAGIETFLKSAYSVTNEFDRMGCRLDGEKVEHIKDGNIISDGICFGAVQIPSEGKPIIMLADRQTTGGYTKIATVITSDFPVIAQSKFGDQISFESITIQKAQELYLAELKNLKALRELLDSPRVESGFHREYNILVGKETFHVVVDSAE